MNESAYREAEQRLWESVGAAPTERFVTMPRSGARVRVQEVGEGDPVLFIHGGPNSGSTWAPLVEHLDGFRCLIVDRAGTGLSESTHIGLENLAEVGDTFVADLLDGLGIESAHVVASSFGGYLALRSAVADPGRVRRMVQMACPAFVPGFRVPPFMRLTAVGAVRRVLAKLPPSRRANDAILRQIGHGASLDAGTIPDVFMDWYLALGAHTDTMRNEGEMIGRLGSFRGFDPSLTLPPDFFAAVSAPTLFLWGADDAFGGESVARPIVEWMPDAGLVMIPHSGHLPWIDDPESIARRTAAFLATVPGEAPSRLLDSHEGG